MLRALTLKTVLCLNLLVCGELATPLGDRLTSWVYSTTFVQYLYISCYLSENKPVLSYLLLHLLPRWWPRSGCTLCIVTVLSYTHPHTHTLAAISASRSLFCLRKWFCFQILQCKLHRLQLLQHFFACNFAEKSSAFSQIQSFCWK
jgi:hypothetical protein